MLHQHNHLRQSVAVAKPDRCRALPREITLGNHGAEPSGAMCSRSCSWAWGSVTKDECRVEHNLRRSTAVAKPYYAGAPWVSVWRPQPYTSQSSNGHFSACLETTGVIIPDRSEFTCARKKHHCFTGNFWYPMKTTVNPQFNRPELKVNR